MEHPHNLPSITSHNHPQKKSVFTLVLITAVVVSALSSLVTYFVVRYSQSNVTDEKITKEMDRPFETFPTLQN